MGRARRRAEQKREGWWRETPLWAWAAMIIGAVLIAVLIPIAGERGRLSAAQLERLEAQAAETPTPAPTASAPQEVGPARIVVIGDADTGGSPEGGNDEAGWPALLENQLSDVSVQAVSAVGAGYVAVDPETGQTFAEVIDNAPVQGSDAVIVFGSRNDVAEIPEQAVLSTLNKIRLRAPAAQLIVVGPPWPSSAVPAAVRSNRDVVETVADVLGATYVDPIADGWLAGQSELVGRDGANLTDAGHARVAEELEQTVRDALAL